MAAPRIVIAPDSFKDCLSARAVAEAMGRGVRGALPGAEVVILPIADGGEGFAATVLGAMHGERLIERVAGPLGEPVEALWGLLPGGTAVIESAQAAGLERVARERRDPAGATTHGVGELLLAAARRGAREAIVGLGGSATNDAGLGMAMALGWRFFDAGGEPIAGVGTGADLGRVARIERPLQPLALHIRAACDVDNPLIGPAGATRTYAPQKGATGEQVERLEAGMARFAAVLARDVGAVVAECPGAGAAGGLGAGLVAFTGASLEPGAPLVLEMLRFDDHLQGASLVITGEGAVNAQSQRGKGPWIVCQRAAARGVPVLVLAGDVREAPPALRAMAGVTVAPIAPPGTPAEESMQNAERFLEEAVAQRLRSGGPSYS